MILFCFFKYRIYKLANLHLLKMVWLHRRKVYKGIYSYRHAKYACFYLLARLYHYAPAELVGDRDKWEYLVNLVAKWEIDTGLV